MGKVFFITGTDTGVGKTVVTAALAYKFQSQGVKVGVVKAVQCGSPSDMEFVRKQAGLAKQQVFSPIKLKYPLAPQQAADLEHKPPIDTEQLIKDILKFSKKNEVTLIEGAGGLYVPIRHGYCMIDLGRDLGVPVIIVSRTALGTINHTVLTIKALQANKLKIEGVVYNSSLPVKDDLSVKLNPFVIAEMSSVRTLGVLEYSKKLDIKKMSSTLRI